MRLSTKTALAVTIVMGGFLAGSIAIQRLVIYPSFVTLEQHEAVKDWERCRSAIERENEHLMLLCRDWAFWDEAYNYVQGKNPAFFEQNLRNQDWFVDQRMDVVYFVRPDGTVHYSHAADHTQEAVEQVELTWLPRTQLPPDHPLMQIQPHTEGGVKGLSLTELGPMLIVANPILTSEYTGPSAGVLIFGRSITPEVVEMLGEQTQVHFTTMPLSRALLSPADQQSVESAIASGKPQIIKADKERLAVVGVMPDLTGKPLLMIRSETQRAITAHGIKAMATATGAWSLAGLATVVTLIMVMRHLIIRPLRQVSDHAIRVAGSGELNARLGLTRKDEIGQLAREFDAMMERLQEYRERTAQMSRQAGMAEIATGVLHNVGNVLNSVNVSARMISDCLKASRLVSLGRLVDLVSQEKQRLGEFVTQDERGRCLPDFLQQLYNKLKQDQESIQQEVDQLTSGIEHIKEVVRMQQSAATSSTLVAPVEPTSIMEDAVKVNLVSMERHEIHLHREYEPNLPLMPLDKHKVLQILINLINNAKKATCQVGHGDRHITLRVRRTNEGQAVQFEVQDNGIGIEPAIADKLFQHGFTRFPNGHGFGLHSGANAAAEMKGTLQARSDGPGTGATFTLTLPVDESALIQA